MRALCVASRPHSWLNRHRLNILSFHWNKIRSSWYFTCWFQITWRAIVSVAHSVEFDRFVRLPQSEPRTAENEWHQPTTAALARTLLMRPLWRDKSLRTTNKEANWLFFLFLFFCVVRHLVLQTQWRVWGWKHKNRETLISGQINSQCGKSRERWQEGGSRYASYPSYSLGAICTSALHMRGSAQTVRLHPERI